MVSEARMRKPSAPDRALTWLVRAVYVVAILLCAVYHEPLQSAVDATYAFLHSTWVFNSVYFETWWATLCYPIIMLGPKFMDKLSCLDRYKIDPRVSYTDKGVLGSLLEGVVYASPLMLLDTFLTKRYHGLGIDPLEWQTRRASLIQTTRALPGAPPTVLHIAVHLVLSFLAYDILFGIVHFCAHKNLWLYRFLHAKHHDHEEVSSRVTNQMTVIERTILVLSANEALKMCNAHPLTRVIFVPLFLGWITENHCGYDFPWTLNHVVPGGVVGGSPAHYAHHVYGERHYQPFFTYIDTLMDKMHKRSKNHVTKYKD